ncbi:MAG: helix-turn-helix domain-containing protein, partial [Candidatus Marinimicrobia bacterium]|nr:helix-turn-helix domain-containing protein [Candidatus Neomarinimicrobiota bacterium]
MDYNFITLKEATKECRCTQRHLSLLCRQGKIRAQKRGKTWYTKKEWVDAYFSNQQNTDDVVLSQNITKITPSPVRVIPLRIAIPIAVIMMISTTAFADAAFGYPASTFAKKQAEAIWETTTATANNVSDKVKITTRQLLNTTTQTALSTGDDITNTITKISNQTSRLFYTTQASIVSATNQTINISKATTNNLLNSIYNNSTLALETSENIFENIKSSTNELINHISNTTTSTLASLKTKLTQPIQIEPPTQLASIFTTVKEGWTLAPQNIKELWGELTQPDTQTEIVTTDNESVITTNTQTTTQTTDEPVTPTQPTQVINQTKVVERTNTIERIVAGITQKDLDNLNAYLLSQIDNLKSDLTNQTTLLSRQLADSHNTVAQTQIINQIYQPTISSPTITSPTISGDANLETLSVSGSTSLTGSLSVSGTISGTISTTNATITFASTTAITTSGTASTTNQIISNNFTFGNHIGFLYGTSGVVTASSTIADGYFEKTGDWTGTFDGQEGTYYLNAINLTNFGTPFYTYFNATTTDALSEGSTNWYATQTRWDTFWNASTTVDSITTLSNLTTTGALDSGSITSNFGSIDIGSSNFTTTGLGTFTNASTTLLSSTGSTWLAVDGGNVGIGTTVPGAKLHVAGTVGISSASPLVYLRDASDNLQAGFGMSDAAEGKLRFAVGTSGLTSDTKMTIQSDGNVGIGTTGPLGRFEVNDGTNTDFIVTTDGFVGIGTTGPHEPLEIHTSGNISSDFLLSQDDVGWRIRHNYQTNGINIGYSTDFSSYSEKVTILNNGNVGIGTTGPNMPLEVYHATLNNVALFKSGDSVGGISLSDNSTTADGYVSLRAIGDGMGFVTGNGDSMRIDSSGNVGIGTTGPLAMLSVRSTGTTDLLNLVETDGTEVFTVLENGKVGIGTTSPQDLFHVYSGTGNVAARFESSDANMQLKLMDGNTTSDTSVQLVAQGDDLGIWTGGSQSVEIQSDGNVGIGTTSPGEKLDIGTGNIVLDNGYQLKMRNTVGAASIVGRWEA